MTLTFSASMPVFSTANLSKATSTAPSRPRARSRPTHARMALSVLDEKASEISHVRSDLSNHAVSEADTLWETMQREAREVANGEPLLASFLFSTVLNQKSLYSALAFHLANKLESSDMPSTLLVRLFEDVLQRDASVRAALREDLLAVMERDPACSRLIDALLYFKGFHALQTHRIAHSLWKAGRATVAYHLQSQVSKHFQVDIHPNAEIGAGAFLDHATGVVIGETVTIGASCSMLHHVTLGGSGAEKNERHPTIGDGVLIGAGATVLGNVHIGDGVQVGARSLVLADVPDHCTVVGVPARIVKRQRTEVPSEGEKQERCIECMKGTVHTEHIFKVPDFDTARKTQWKPRGNAMSRGATKLRVKKTVQLPVAR